MPSILTTGLIYFGAALAEIERVLLSDPRVLEAVDRKEQVVLYGDYDVDGVSSLALLKTLLEAKVLAQQSVRLVAALREQVAR